MVRLSQPYMTTGKTIALIRQTFVSKVMSLLFNMLSRFVLAFLTRSKCLLISWLQSPSAVIFEAQENKICQEPLFPLRSLHFSSKSLTISRIVKSISRSPFCMVLGAPKVGSTPWILEYKILLVLKKTQSRPLPQATVFPSSAHFEDLPHIHAWWVGQPWLSYLWKRNLLMVGTPLTSYSSAQLSNLATLHHSLSLEYTVDFQTTWLGWYCFWFYLEYPVFLLLLVESLTHFLESM